MPPRKARMGLGQGPGAEVQTPWASGERVVEEFSASAAPEGTARGARSPEADPLFAGIEVVEAVGSPERVARLGSSARDFQVRLTTFDRDCQIRFAHCSHERSIGSRSSQHHPCATALSGVPGSVFTWIRGPPQAGNATSVRLGTGKGPEATSTNSGPLPSCHLNYAPRSANIDSARPPEARKRPSSSARD